MGYPGLLHKSYCAFQNQSNAASSYQQDVCSPSPVAHTFAYARPEQDTEKQGSVISSPPVSASPDPAQFCGWKKKLRQVNLWLFQIWIWGEHKRPTIQWLSRQFVFLYTVEMWLRATSSSSCILFCELGKVAQNTLMYFKYPWLLPMLGEKDLKSQKHWCLGGSVG